MELAYSALHQFCAPMLDRLRFLANTGDVSGARTVLVVQSGAPELLSQAIEMLRGALPPVRMTVLLQRNMRGSVVLRDDIEYLETKIREVIMNGLAELVGSERFRPISFRVPQRTDLGNDP